MTKQDKYFLISMLTVYVIGIIVGMGSTYSHMKEKERRQQAIIDKLEIQLKISAPHSFIQDDNYDEEDIAIV